MAKIVIADSDFVVSDIEQKMIEDAGIEFARFQDKSAAGIVKNCADAEGIITAYGEFPREVFAALPKLEVVSRTGVGYDTLDLAAATEIGVAVCNVTGYATEVVSDHACAAAAAARAERGCTPRHLGPNRASPNGPGVRAHVRRGGYGRHRTGGGTEGAGPGVRGHLLVAFAGSGTTNP